MVVCGCALFGVYSEIHSSLCLELWDRYKATQNSLAPGKHIITALAFVARSTDNPFLRASRSWIRPAFSLYLSPTAAPRGGCVTTVRFCRTQTAPKSDKDEVPQLDPQNLYSRFVIRKLVAPTSHDTPSFMHDPVAMWALTTPCSALVGTNSCHITWYITFLSAILGNLSTVWCGMVRRACHKRFLRRYALTTS